MGVFGCVGLCGLEGWGIVGGRRVGGSGLLDGWGDFGEGWGKGGLVGGGV